MTENDILKALGTVEEPDFKKDLVTLNMVEDIKIENNTVSFTVVLTTPACPLKDLIKNRCFDAIHAMINKDVEIKINFTSRTTSLRTDKKDVLKDVKNIIAVVSGKGGVGKSTVASNLALAIAESGAKMGFMDADIYGPSGHIMFGIRGQRPQMRDVDGKGKIVPIERYGIKIMSIGLLVDERQAVVWRGPMVSSAIRQFVTDVDWGELDYLIIDMPPGTGDIHLTSTPSVPGTGARVVTTPQLVAWADAKKGIAMFNQPGLKVPVIGLVENMSYFTPKELPGNKYYIFGKEGGKNLASEFDIPFLGEIPLVQSIREGGDLGIPAMIGDDEISKKAFIEFSDNAIRGIALRNAQVPLAEASVILETV
jgi:ATP-binding protein involved in chromosome partitioning